MTKEELEKIEKEIIEIIKDSKATFFVKNEDIEIPTDEALCELKAEITTNIERYFYYKLNEKTNKTRRLSSVV
jgi:hypothetical protein